MAEAATGTTITEALHGPYAGLDLDALVDWPVVRTWLFWGMFWLMVAPTVGALLAGLFNYPEYLGTHLPLTFGRLRPVHVNGVIMGAFSSLFIGECYYLVPRLCGVRVAFNRWGVVFAWVWNVFLAAGTDCGAARLQPRARGGRAAPARGNSHFFLHRRRHAAISDDYRPPASIRRSTCRSGT